LTAPRTFRDLLISMPNCKPTTLRTARHGKPIHHATFGASGGRRRGCEAAGNAQPVLFALDGPCRRGVLSVVSFPPGTAQLEVRIEVVVALVINVPTSMQGDPGLLVLERATAEVTAGIVRIVRIMLGKSWCPKHGTDGEYRQQ
jgi:hypothetical protein